MAQDMRQWWRRTGRELSFPIDGVTQPTKPAGAHVLSFAEGKNRCPLAPGQYKLMVEAAREVGGRELVSIPFEWPAKSATSLSATGKTELGAIKLNVTPERFAASLSTCCALRGRQLARLRLLAVFS